MKSLRENIDDCFTCSGECSGECTGCRCPYFYSLVLTAVFFVVVLYDIIKNVPADEKGVSIIFLCLFTFIVFMAFIITFMLVKGFWRTIKQALEELKCSK